ncbi:UTP:RNA uridylyltransferase 1 [Galdieria sulphuraria]|nr:UTP:RNA uridylyltransferase 1 [Galdieria sulphuraria]
MRKENTRVDAALNEETMFSKKNELEPKNEPCLTHKSNTSEASENSETHEPDKDTSVDKKIGMEDELVLKKLSRVAVSSKPGGAWAAGPPSSMLHDTNLERSEAPSQHKSPQVETKEVTIESADRSRESQFSEKTKQETGKSKEQSHLKGSSKSSPVSSTSKQTTPRSFNSVGRETVTNGNIGHSKSDALSSSWPVLGTMGQPLSVVSPGAGPYATVLNSQKPGEGDDSNVREWKKQKDVNLGSEVGSESSKYSPFLTNGYHSVQYPFYSYPSPYMPMQNMFFPPWLLYPYAPPVAFPRPPNISGAYASNAHLHDGDQQKESNNMVNSKVPFSVQHTHGGNLSHGESTSDSQNAQKQDGMEAQKDLKVTKKDNLQPYGGAEKSPKGSSSTNGKNTFSPLVASPPPFGSFPGSFEKSQSMAAFYSPWPMMTPPFFWFPDPRMIDPYQTVTETALYIHQRIRPTKDESIRKASLFRHLYKLCQNEWKHCDLWMFGSSINSFGLRSGDLDMCLTVPSEDAIHRVTGERLEERHIVNRLGVILRQAKMENVECRFRARVPIVKFHDPLTRLSVDVCINNKLARHNSALLRTYASLDPRVQVLGLLIKLAQSAIVFLSLNSESVGLLLTEFFGFYAYSFDYSKDVVSIRSGRLLTREEKDWFVPPLDARIEESDEEDEHVSLDNHNATTSPLDSHADIFPHDMAFVHREPHDKVGQKAISDEEGIKHTNSSVLSPKMPVMNIWRMPKKHKRFKELHVFCIEDPFDTSHDIGRVVDEDSLEVLREEFIRAYEVIRTTGNFLEVCRPYEPEVTS